MEGGGATVANKAEIDTSAPFRSVREAVMLFGERVLAGEVYANKLKEMQDKKNEHGDGAVASELEETKQNLKKSHEESIHMAKFLSSLQQELEQTKRELEQLKTRASDTPHALDQDTEDLKYVENYSREITEQVKTETPVINQSVEFQKKKCVSFANNPSVARVVVPSPPPSAAVLERHPSVLKKKKKKQLIPFIAGIFSKKRGSCDATLA